MIDQDRAKLQLAAVVGAVLGIVTGSIGWERMVHRTYLGAHWCSRCQRNGLLSSGFSVVNAARRFPPPWSVEE
jgi:hypothetical protein